MLTISSSRPISAAHVLCCLAKNHVPPRGGLSKALDIKMKLLPDIERYVREYFEPVDVEMAIQILENAKIHDDTEAESRLLRCALIACDKTLRGLRHQIEGLAIDYRDVILSAEYARKKGEWVKIRDLSNPLTIDA